MTDPSFEDACAASPAPTGHDVASHDTFKNDDAARRTGTISRPANDKEEVSLPRSLANLSVNFTSHRGDDDVVGVEAEEKFDQVPTDGGEDEKTRPRRRGTHRSQIEAVAVQPLAFGLSLEVPMGRTTSIRKGSTRKPLDGAEDSLRLASLRRRSTNVQTVYEPRATVVISPRSSSVYQVDPPSKPKARTCNVM